MSLATFLIQIADVLVNTYLKRIKAGFLNDSYFFEALGENVRKDRLD